MEDLLSLNAPWYYSDDDKPVRLHKYMQLALSLYLGIITQNTTCVEVDAKADGHPGRFR